MKSITEEVDDVIAELKSSLIEPVWEAKIKIVEDVEKGNTGSWNMVGWRDALAKLTGKLVNVSGDPVGPVEKTKEGEDEEKKEEAEVNLACVDQSLGSN